MTLYIANDKLEVIGTVDGFKSLIWANRYSKIGDFELDIVYSDKAKELFKQDCYVWRDIDVINGVIERPKIIEYIQLINNTKEDYLHITGRDASAILGRRIIYPGEVLKDTVDNCIYYLIDKCVINPENNNRKIATFDTSTESIIEEEIDSNVLGDNLLQYIENVCNDYKLGFRTDIIEGSERRFKFSIFNGEDRCDLEFSREMGNVIKFDYLSDMTNFRNMAVVAGTGEGTDRKIIDIGDDLEGLNRRELWVDARDLQNVDKDGRRIPDEDYMKQLEQRGSEKLSESKTKINNGCEIDPSKNYVFKRDYFVGDIVTIRGYVNQKERIVESTESITALGVKTELAYEEIEEDD